MTNIKLFQDTKIRSVWNEEEEQWYFSVVDVVEALTDSINPTDYLKKLRKRDNALANYIGTNCPPGRNAYRNWKETKSISLQCKRASVHHPIHSFSQGRTI